MNKWFVYFYLWLIIIIVMMMMLMVVMINQPNHGIVLLGSCFWNHWKIQMWHFKSAMPDSSDLTGVYTSHLKTGSDVMFPHAFTIPLFQLAYELCQHWARVCANLYHDVLERPEALKSLLVSVQSTSDEFTVSVRKGVALLHSVLWVCDKSGQNI